RRYQTADEVAAALRGSLAANEGISSRGAGDAGVLCGSCGSIVPRGQKFCGDCGARVAVPVAMPLRAAIATTAINRRNRLASLPRLPGPLPAPADHLDWRATR